MKTPNYLSIKGYCSFALIFLLLSFSQLAKSQCPVTDPTGTGNCSYNNGNILLTASGSSGFYNWYENSSGGIVIGSGSSFTTPNIANSTT